MSDEIKIGDEVQIVDCACGSTNCSNGQIKTIERITIGDNGRYYLKGSTSGWELKNLKLIKKQKIMSSLSEKFALALTPEPQKSFRKAGITNGDNILTDEGAKIFLTWVLGKNQDAFKKEVVDGILEAQKEEGK